MVVFRGLSDPRLLPRPSAVAVGNFDGCHRGHLRLLERLRARAGAAGLRSLVLTFEPHPERALGRRSVRLIDTPAQRLDRLRATGVDAVVLAAFGKSFARLSCREFVERVLRDRLGAREVVVGRGFRFGRGRRGGVDLLRRLGREAGLSVRAVPPAVLDGRIVSSTAVRALLARGRVEEAARLLGRPYEIAGRVVPGKKRGRLLGYPTANLDTANELLPEGIYISETVKGRTAHPSVTSIGTNPTFGPNPLTVETLLLDFRGSLYGAGVTVRLLRRLRRPRAFAGAEALAAAIARDIAAAADWFARRG